MARMMGETRRVRRGAGFMCDCCNGRPVMGRSAEKHALVMDLQEELRDAEVAQREAQEALVRRITEGGYWEKSDEMIDAVLADRAVARLRSAVVSAIAA